MTEKIDILLLKKETPGQWLVDQEISAGFPSPADDFKEIRIVDRELVKNEEATFYAKGRDSMTKFIKDGDILAIDRSLNPKMEKLQYVL